MLEMTSKLPPNASRPLVTIVVPVYNYTEFLYECLSTVISQTMSSWETIVVDDGSSRGNSLAVVQSIGHERIRLIQHSENRGLAAARNTGIRAAQGRFIVPLDADDRLAPTYLEKTLAAAGDGECNAVFTDFLAFGASSVRMPFRVGSVQTLMREQWIPGPGTLFPRELWEAVGGYCEADTLRPGNEDWEFWLSAADHGLKAVHVPEPLYMYRIHSESMMKRLEYCDYITREFIYSRHRALFDRYNMKSAFLSGGYLSSAKAHWRRRERRRAISLGVRSFSLSPGGSVRWLGEQALRLVRRHLVVSSVGGWS
jgi:glycosyltransferase involved in cell wall biosynthesis